MPQVETSTPTGTPEPIGPYSHIAKAGTFICISATAGVDPVTGRLAGPDVASQTRAILRSFDVMLRSVGSDFEHILHINVFLRDMNDFGEMNQAYIDMLGAYRPARSVIAVLDVPKQGAALTMNLTAACKD